MHEPRLILMNALSFELCDDDMTREGAVVRVHVVVVEVELEVAAVVTEKS